MTPRFAPVFAFAAAVASSLCTAGEPKPASELGVLCERIEMKRSLIADRQVTVTDWKIRLSNRDAAPRWIVVVGTPTAENYLKERNPRQISYRVMELRGSTWMDTYKGYAVIVGAGGKWMKIAPGESVEFTAPLPGRFQTPDAQVRLEFKLTADPSSKDQKTLASQTFTYQEPKEEKPPAADPAKK